MRVFSTMPQWLIFGVISFASLLALFVFNSFLNGLIAVSIVAFGAFLLAVYLHDGAWWRWIHLAFMPLVVFFLQFDISPNWYLLILVLSWLIFGKVMVSRVPLYLSNQKALFQLAESIPHGVQFLDVGAGTGKVLRYLAAARADLSLSGVEHASIPWLWGKLRLPASVRWLHKDYQTIDFANYDCIYAFLSPVVMSDIWSQVRSQMRPGSLFISNTFVVPGVAPDQVIELNDWKSGKLLLWRM
ncbi:MULTISPECIES: class I SAM-dependent methyltransferase [Deefgea]|uniref:Methyltransferase type 12 n=1 Tax=Deefgea chitinilytica TaxID=570276 RepID=A0ABS2C8Z5_9NEIS|nr:MULTISPECIES: class I SAM-dependent methyltransferase [Deefgea]MBM5570522.1 methyltransferase type 12 [Deefgea chitinilytica]MBM9887751.1 class I SAM-dependent methyltransferase [Deefgea sp. CFH1-16]